MTKALIWFLDDLFARLVPILNTRFVVVSAVCRTTPGHYDVCGFAQARIQQTMRREKNDCNGKTGKLACSGL